MNTPVNFELAKLLKEKGFDNRTAMVWSLSLGKPHLIKTHLSLELNDSEYNAPIIADVVMWLYEKHGIWIIVAPIPYSDNLTHWRWEHVSTNYSTRNARWTKEQDYMSPTEAYEAALEYCITKIIP